MLPRFIPSSCRALKASRFISTSIHINSAETRNDSPSDSTSGSDSGTASIIPALTKTERIQISKHLDSLLPQYNRIGSKPSSSLYTNQASFKAQTDAREAAEIDSLTISSLVSAGVHLGHTYELMHPLNLNSVFGTRNGINVINLEKTIMALRRAGNFVKTVAQNGGIILFAGTKPFMRKLTIDAAYRCDQFYVVDKWVAGTITNSSHLLTKQSNYIVDRDDVFINQGSFQLPELEEKTPEIKKKKSRYEARQEELLKRTEIESNNVKTYKPDVIIALNPYDLTTMLNEANRAYIPTIGIADTNFDPTHLSFAIPGNDDSASSAKIIAEYLSSAALIGKNNRQRIITNNLKKKTRTAA
ncbi:30S ribosomal protein S2 [Smittium mucronatum]|uniref:30S ribosomal protein S2 n=1 Tax=Smittium mucronatum TaxID=133383 RepID=A0A1R0H5N7_9FUNG|nr:30S ribosomal protein S2 [Smittium mucronatum]